MTRSYFSLVEILCYEPFSINQIWILITHQNDGGHWCHVKPIVFFLLESNFLKNFSAFYLIRLVKLSTLPISWILYFLFLLELCFSLNKNRNIRNALFFIMIKCYIISLLLLLGFLDVKFDLDNNVYKPIHKENNKPIYINKHSNHLPSILRQISKSN